MASIHLHNRHRNSPLGKSLALLLLPSDSNGQRALQLQSVWKLPPVRRNSSKISPAQTRDVCFRVLNLDRRALASPLSLDGHSKLAVSCLRTPAPLPAFPRLPVYPTSNLGQASAASTHWCSAWPNEALIIAGVSGYAWRTNHEKTSNKKK